MPSVNESCRKSMIKPSEKTNENKMSILKSSVKSYASRDKDTIDRNRQLTVAENSEHSLVLLMALAHKKDSSCRISNLQELANAFEPISI